jgi:hypothetical protein
LNQDVIPDQEYLDHLSKYQTKFDTNLLRTLCKQAGLQSPDERVYKVISVMLELKLNEITKEVGAMHSQSL